MKKKTIIEIVLSISLIALVSVFGLLEIKDATAKLPIMKPGLRNLSQVLVKSAGKYGRGVVFDIDEDYVYIVTSKHVVEEELYPNVMFGNRYEYPAETVYFYNDDAAILKVNRKTVEENVKTRPVKCLSREEYDLLSEGETLFFLDDIFDDSLTVSEGTLLNKETYIKELYCDAGIFEGIVKEGMSGEGVFDENQKLVGIIMATDDEKGAFVPAYKLENQFVEVKNYE